MALGNWFYGLFLLFCSDAAEGCIDHGVTFTAPNPITALSGSCLKIPCRYTPTALAIDPTKPFTGMWFKSNYGYGVTSEFTFSVSGSSTKSYPMNITGDLKNKDCTTMFYNVSQNHQDKYYFRIENGVNRGTAVCVHLQISVRDSPWWPSLNVSGNQTESEVVNITCSAVAPCPLAPPQLTWNLHQGTANITETNPDGIIITKSNLSITLTDSDDGKVIKCFATYPVSGGVKTTENNITLNVTYGPKNTSVQVSPSGSLSAGRAVTLNCSSRANPPVHTFTWFRHSSQGPVSVSEGHTYNFNLTEDGDFHCVASNALGNKSSPVVHLQVSEDEPSAVIYTYNIIQLCGILLLYSSLVTFECWFRASHGKKPEQQPEPTYVNRVVETRA